MLMLSVAVFDVKGRVPREIRKRGNFNKLEIHSFSNPSPLTKSMQLYFRNYMKYLYRLLS